MALVNTPLYYFYALFEENTVFDAHQIVGTIISILFFLLLIAAAILAVIDCDRHMGRIVSPVPYFIKEM